MEYLQLFAGLILLVVGGNVLVSGSVSLAQKLHVSTLLIGLVLVGFGTSMPELVTSLMAVAHKADGLATGNVIGSNIANILLVLGMAALIRPVKVHPQSFNREAVFLTLSTVILMLALPLGSINFLFGFMMCAALGYYVYYCYITDKKHHAKAAQPEPIPLAKRIHIPTPLILIGTICGLVLTLYGANLLVNGAIVIASHLGVSEAIIGLTIVAFGTSVPELTTAIIASIKKQSDVAVGNVFGSNIYNALFILGFTALFMPVAVPRTMAPDMLVMMAATVAMLYMGYKKGEITRLTGAVFVLSYCIYIIYMGIR